MPRPSLRKGMTPPFRFAGRTIVDIESVDGMMQGIGVEKVGNDHFDEFRQRAALLLRRQEDGAV